MDIPALLWADPDVRFMAAADLFRIPVLAAAMRAVGTVPIDRRTHDRAHDQLDAMVDEQHRGAGGDVAVFAEGGIAPAGQRLPFKSGAFSLAIRTASPLVPVAIHGSDRVLPPRGRLLVRSGVVTVEFLNRCTRTRRSEICSGYAILPVPFDDR
jgi:1-acyl-sn-glycerol-3-phosphate acyltransferase